MSVERRLEAIEGQLADHHRHLLAIQKTLETIMSKISDFAAAMNAFTDRQDKAIADLQGDVQSLQDEIAKLQGTPGDISPADQALLDSIQARASTVADKLDALDAQTPPPVPTP